MLKGNETRETKRQQKGTLDPGYVRFGFPGAGGTFLFDSCLPPGTGSDLGLWLLTAPHTWPAAAGTG